MFDLFRPSPLKEAALSLYKSACEQARSPAFYGEAKVPDTLDGRFDMICLHITLLLRRLKRDSGQAALAQSLFDIMFADIDMNLREMGVSDYAIGHRVKAMASALYGRAAAYEEALAAGEPQLARALERNLFGTTSVTPDLLHGIARYVEAVAASLDGQDDGALGRGQASFPAGEAYVVAASHV